MRAFNVTLTERETPEFIRQIIQTWGDVYISCLCRNDMTDVVVVPYYAGSELHEPALSVAETHEIPRDLHWGSEPKAETKSNRK